MTKTDALPTGELHLLVMAGGSSSRLFPYNKVVSDLTGCGRSMIQQALDRGIARTSEDENPLVAPDHFHVVTGGPLVDPIREQLPEIGASGVLIEPERRNTLPAILWAVAAIRAKDPQAVVAVLTADHVIGDLGGFRGTLRDAVAIASETPAIVTIGIPPSENPSDWTAFGAVRVGETAGVDAVPSARSVERFEEKPSLERASELVGQGDTFWNSGMFVFRIDRLETALETYCPEVCTGYLRLAEHVAAGREAEAADAFRALPAKITDPVDASGTVDNTIDYAVMVPLTQCEGESPVRASLVPARFSWVDVGSWDAMRSVIPADDNGNVVVGDVEAEDTTDCILVAAAGQRLRVTGKSGLVIVAGKDRTVVVPEARAQEVKVLFQACQGEAGDQDVILDCDAIDRRGGDGAVAALGVSAIEIVREGSETHVGPSRLAEIADVRARLLLGATLDPRDLEPCGLRPQDGEWLAAVDRERDGSGFHGIDLAPTGDVEAAALQTVGIDPTLLGAYDIRGDARRFTEKTVFRIGLSAARLLHERGFDGAFNITASHNPSSDDGIKWSVRPRRGERPVALVGRSIRKTSARIQNALIEGLRSGGIDVVDLGETATPETYHALALCRPGDGAPAADGSLGRSFVRSLDAEEAASIYTALPKRGQPETLTDPFLDAEGYRGTRSVDPVEYWRHHATWIQTLVRVGPAAAESLFETWIEGRDAFPELMAILESLEWPDTPDDDAWRAICDRLELGDEFRGSCPVAAVALPFRGRTIGTDFANGSNWRKSELLADLGFEVVPVVADVDGKRIDSSKPDGSFPLHHPDPTKPEYQRHAIDLACERSIPVVMFDEDGDRFSIIDERGRAVNGAEIACLLAETFDGPILADVRYARYAIDALEVSGRTLDRTLFRGPVGYAYYVEAALAIRDALSRGADAVTLFGDSGRPVSVDTSGLGRSVAFGIEPSGHAFFRSNGYLNDASYFMGAVLSRLATAYADGQDLADLHDTLRKNPASPPELRVRLTPDIPVADRRRFVAAILERLREEADADGLDLSVDPMDGGLVDCREDGEVVSQALIRNSNNESVLGLAFEGRTHADKHRLEERVVRILAATEIDYEGTSVTVDLASPRTSEYLRRRTPENRDGDIDPPCVIERILSDEEGTASLDAAARERLRETQTTA